LVGYQLIGVYCKVKAAINGIDIGIGRRRTWKGEAMISWKKQQETLVLLSI
jgi:hypothetical protein